MSMQTFEVAMGLQFNLLTAFLNAYQLHCAKVIDQM